MASLLQPRYPWGEQPHHEYVKWSFTPFKLLTVYSSPRTGFYALSEKIVRNLPTATDDVTHETIHSSVLRIPPHLKASIKNNIVIVARLQAFEEEIRKLWPYVHGRYPPRDHETKEKLEKLLLGLTIQREQIKEVEKMARASSEILSNSLNGLCKLSGSGIYSLVLYTISMSVAINLNSNSTA